MGIHPLRSVSLSAALFLDPKVLEVAHLAKMESQSDIIHIASAVCDALLGAASSCLSHDASLRGDTVKDTKGGVAKRGQEKHLTRRIPRRWPLNNHFRRVSRNDFHGAHPRDILLFGTFVPV